MKLTDEQCQSEMFAAYDILYKSLDFFFIKRAEPHQKILDLTGQGKECLSNSICDAICALEIVIDCKKQLNLDFLGDEKALIEIFKLKYNQNNK